MTESHDITKEQYRRSLERPGSLRAALHDAMDDFLGALDANSTGEQRAEEDALQDRIEDLIDQIPLEIDVREG